MGPILFLYYEESLLSSYLNSKLFRFHCVRLSVYICMVAFTSNCNNKDYVGRMVLAAWCKLFYIFLLAGWMGGSGMLDEIYRQTLAQDQLNTQVNFLLKYRFYSQAANLSIKVEPRQYNPCFASKSFDMLTKSLFFKLPE